jgi:hypothetical protein
MAEPAGPVAPSSLVVRALGVRHLERLRARMAARPRPLPATVVDGYLDHRLLDVLGLGLEQAFGYLAGAKPSSDELATWVLETAGRPDPLLVDRFNAVVTGDPYPDAARRWLASVDAMEDVLSPEDMSFWRENGFVVLHDAVEPRDRERAVAMIWREVNGDPEDPDTWYRGKTRKTMLQIFQDPALSAMRRSARVHKAFAQIWGTPDLIVSTDRCGFSAPLRAGETSKSPPMHWDFDFRYPERLATQGILYLTDTREDQGAFSVVPGFHHRLKEWLEGLPEGADPNAQDLEALGPHPIAGRAGDLIIWHGALPHGSRPNHHDRPRIVHYMNMYPARLDANGEVYRGESTRTAP